MIALVSGDGRGRAAPDHVVVDCGGVGYRLAVSAETLQARAGGRRAGHAARAPGRARRRACTLYGFATEEERELFLLLLGVQAVGPKVALAVLSGGPPRELLAAIAAGDAARFQAVPGHRQAHRRADHRRAAREGRRGAPTSDAIIDHRARDDPRALARDGPGRPRLLRRRRPTSCSTAADGETPEDLIAQRAEGVRAR